jgi:rifampicin phosphotransferase
MVMPALIVWRVHWALGDGDSLQDVEWAHDGVQFWILQARPVTGLPHYTFEAIKHLPVIWSTANIKDAVPGVVSIFAWSMIMEAIDSILYAGPRLRGYEIPLGMQSVKRIDGHAYFDLTALQATAAASVAREPGAAGLCLARSG